LRSGWAQQGLFPIGFHLNPMQVGKVVFRDLWLPLLYLLLLVLLGQVLWRQLKQPRMRRRMPFSLIGLVCRLVAGALCRGSSPSRNTPISSAAQAGEGVLFTTEAPDPEGNHHDSPDGKRHRMQTRAPLKSKKRLQIRFYSLLLRMKRACNHG
jgi:hypothetical protein